VAHTLRYPISPTSSTPFSPIRPAVIVQATAAVSGPFPRGLGATQVGKAHGGIAGPIKGWELGSLRDDTLGAWLGFLCFDAFSEAPADTITTEPAGGLTADRLNVGRRKRPQWIGL
jgi:hypothetical protein